MEFTRTNPRPTPTFQDVMDFFKKEALYPSPHKFYHFYEKKGWTWDWQDTAKMWHETDLGRQKRAAE